MTATNLTIEDLEALADTMGKENHERRGKLNRLCVAYARIIGLAKPDAFEPEPCQHGDEAGSWDSSYPPDQVYSEHTGPETITIRSHKIEDVATGGGFYYPWRRVTVDGGLAIDRDGAWYRADETGTGRLGRFAAHPGDCDVTCEIAWCEVDVEDLDVEELDAAERKLRDLAFPLVAARRAAGSAP